MKLICACCGGEAPSRRQWFNQDTGYSICARCFLRVLEHETRALGEMEGLTYALKAYGLPGVHHTTKATPSLFHKVIVCDVPFASHETDLYIPATDQTRAILKEFPVSDANKTTFQNQVEGGTWYDIPFAYLPAWERKGRPSIA